ncbi:MAG: chromosomal replication initiator protein DnaA [Clostridia bacterium]|nr:chromosomal replication initiator protein DnaA [Clostridia bacterium]
MDVTMQRWKEICEVILVSESVEEFQFNTWIDPISRVEFHGDTLFIWAPSPIAVNNLNKNYAAIIKEAAFRVMNKEYNVVVLDPLVAVAPKDGKNPTDEKNLVPKKDYYLNPKYNFRTFVVGNSNKLAHAYALMVAENPGDSTANPLFIYGGTGLGKTHLSQAIAQFMLEKNSDTKIMYVAAETYTNEYIRSLQNKTTERFRDKYRNVDILIIDDIQFIVGKEATIAEFFHTFSELHAKNKQIVITSDRFPKHLKGMDERLVGRFLSGLTCDVTKPDVETRFAILKNNCLAEGINISDDVLVFISEKIRSNVRELEGALNKVITYCKLEQKPVTLPMAELLLKDYVFAESDKEDLTYDKIISTVAEYFAVTVEDILSPKKIKNIATARQVAMFISFNKVKNTNVTAVARAFERDHSTISHAVQKITASIEKHEEIETVIQDIIQKLSE